MLDAARSNPLRRRRREHRLALLGVKRSIGPRHCNQRHQRDRRYHLGVDIEFDQLLQHMVVVDASDLSQRGLHFGGSPCLPHLVEQRLVAVLEELVGQRSPGGREYRIALARVCHGSPRVPLSRLRGRVQVVGLLLEDWTLIADQADVG